MTTSAEGPARRVLLIFPPFGALSFPSIGLGLLKRALVDAGIECDVRYLNFDLLDLLPGEFLDRLASYDEIQRRNEHCVGDWLFTDALYDEKTARELDAQFRSQTLASGADEAFVRRCFETKAVVPGFLEKVLDEIPWDRYSIVGFHSLFNQTTASLAIARLLKERHPHIITLLGGPNAADEMGVELVRRFPQIDYAVRGEADRTIVPMIRGLLDGQSIADVPGVIRRVKGRSLVGGSAVLGNPPDSVREMDELPIPDYDDYFERIRGRDYAQAMDVFIPMENARGCWWGAKHHCVFCGLDANNMKFRFKSAERVMREVHHQVARYGVRSLTCVDSILEMSYFRTLLPTLRDSQLGLRIFCWVKANLSHAQVDLLADAGVQLVQPGLEHLSSEVLAVMRKGTTLLQNVQFLKWSRERDMTVFWSILYGFPGEQYAWYERVAEEIQSLVHLYPPKGAFRARVDRFSPMFTDPAGFGIASLSVFDGYRSVYPFPDSALARLGYQFEGTFAERDPALDGQIADLIAPQVEAWNRGFFRENATLELIVGSQHSLVVDRRSGRKNFVLRGLAHHVYLACDGAAPRRALEQLAVELGSLQDNSLLALFNVSPEDVVIDRLLEQAEGRGEPIAKLDGHEGIGSLPALLDQLLDARLLLSEAQRYLALAVRVRDPQVLLERDEQRQRSRTAMAATRRISLDL